MATQPQGEVLSPQHEEEGVEVQSSGISAIEESTLNHQVLVAHRYPRSLTKFLKDLTEIAQMSQPVAQEMMYSVPRAGKQLIGPSVRFAEALLSCWGNSTATVETLDADAEWITAEARFYDAETNVRIAVRVRRRITDRDGRRFNADMIGVTGAAASSIALRGAILRGVPKAFWADKFEMAKRTAVGDVASMKVLIEASIKYFTGAGVTEVQVYNALGVEGIADIGADELLSMTAWQKSLRAQEATIEDIFGSPEDYDIERYMTALKWNETKKRTSRTAFTGKRSEHLAYLKGEAAKASITLDEKQPPKKEKETKATSPAETEAIAGDGNLDKAKSEAEPPPETQQVVGARMAKPATAKNKTLW